MADDRADAPLLSLFENAGPVETPTPNVRAWVAHDGANGRRVLIKRLPGGAGRARATEALALVHPNIVRTRRWIAEGGALYVVRDIVRGKNLRQSLAVPGGARPSPELIRRILLPVIDALAYAHAQGVAHGGLSPENILIGEDGAILVSDWATADPGASRHLPAYTGKVTVAGDVKALGGVLSAYLPTTGPFASVSVRGRLEGIIGRCDTLGDLREALNTLEKLAASVSPQSAEKNKAGQPKPTPTAPPGTGLPWMETEPQATAPTEKPDAQNGSNGPQMIVSLMERNLRLPQGGASTATLLVRNEGNAPLIIRMIATQHAWLNVRPLDLPLTIASGGQAKIGFYVSAARLTPGEYRCEVYLSANVSGAAASAEELRGGWFKHTSEVRLSVDGTVGASGGGAGGKPPYPANAPVLPGGGPGCGGATALLLFAGTSAWAWWHWWPMAAGLFVFAGGAK